MDAVAAAHALTQARVSRSALEALPPSLPDSAGLADGYAVQDAMIAAAAQPGAPLGALVGWKARPRRRACGTRTATLLR